MAESGLPGYEAGLWTAFVFPVGVSPAIVTRLKARGQHRKVQGAGA